jgi:hypothetical protein
MKEDYHIDLSGCFFHKGNTGIAYYSSESKKHKGMVLKSNLKKMIDKTLCIGSRKEEHAKLYAICIFYLVKDILEDIKSLIICNDEDFSYVKFYLEALLPSTISFSIMDIREFQKKLGRNIKSLADNKSKSYRKRGLKKNRWMQGPNLEVIEINYNMIKNKWEELSQNKRV